MFTYLFIHAKGMHPVTMLTTKKLRIKKRKYNLRSSPSSRLWSMKSCNFDE